MMKKYIYILAVLLPLTLDAAPKKAAKSDVKVAVWNLTNSRTRSSDVKKEKAGVQRLWSNSVDAVADQIVSMDCDVIGLHDICDSIAGRVGNAGLPQALKERGADYSWLILSNTRPSMPHEGAYSKTQAIIWKTGKYDCLDWGINWLGGYFDKNRLPKGISGDAAKSVTWARLREVSTGKEFYFMAASVNGASNQEVNMMNCENLMKIADEIIVPDGKPSVIAGSLNMNDNEPGYREYLSQSRWFDVYARLKEETLLPDEDVSNRNTRNNARGDRPSGGRPDYIFVDGFDIVSYKVVRDMYPAADGTPVYSAYGFPVVSELSF